MHSVNFDQNEATVKQLLDCGCAGSEALLKLLEEDNPYVRLTTATNLLGTYEDTALAVLQELKGHQGFTGFNAKMVLVDWRKRDLVVPGFKKVSPTVSRLSAA